MLRRGIFFSWIEPEGDTLDSNDQGSLTCGQLLAPAVLVQDGGAGSRHFQVLQSRCFRAQTQGSAPLHPGLNFSNAFGVLKFPWRYAHQDLQISQRRHTITGCKHPGLLSLLSFGTKAPPWVHFARCEIAKILRLDFSFARVSSVPSRTMMSGILLSRPSYAPLRNC